MCGIFGLVVNKDEKISSDLIKRAVNKLFIFSETRGREAAGIAVNTGSTIDVLKQAVSATSFIRSKKYKDFFNQEMKTYKNNKNNIRKSIAFIGHSRLVTNGFQSNDSNNQPIIISDLVGIHNGIITNDDELWEKNPDLKRDYVVDTEILLKLFRKYLIEGNNIKESIKNTFDLINGSASTSFFINNLPLLALSTNTGALFYIKNKNFFAFASERFILQKFIASTGFISLFGSCKIEQLNAFNGLIFNLNSMTYELFDFRKTLNKENIENSNQKFLKTGNLFIKDHTRSVKDLKRCKSCVLPETYPYIDLDSNGVCRYCRRHKRFKVKGEEKLLEMVDKYRSQDGSPDCIVAFSGGRDSCYGLHYIKKVLGMNPIAFTYDWGLVTDLARRNAARLCGKLGVEHIIRSPDISAKRRFVRKNVEAWLKRPELGMIPLFMSGDKAFYHHARKLRKETGIKLVFFCTGNMIENAPYKFGFSGIKDGESDMVLTGIKLTDKIRLITYYMKHFLLNPSYINESLIDTAAAFWHTFVQKDDFLYLYHFLEWREEKVVNTIINEYGWETSQDTKTTWRIGDGTAAFYNYIYYTMAGFTEDDDMLSNMVREGHITREEALTKSIEFAKPRYLSILEYSQMIGINFEETLTRINSASKLF